MEGTPPTPPTPPRPPASPPSPAAASTASTATTPPPPTVGRPARAADGRRRAALVLLVLALVVPLVGHVAGPMAAVSDPLAVLGAVAVVGVALALVAAGVAPVGVGPRAAVVAVSLANGGVGLSLSTLETPLASSLPMLVSALTGPLQVPALAWLGAALAADLGDGVRRSWRTAMVLTGVLAGLQVLLSVLAIGTYGAAFRFTGGVTAYVLAANALSAASTVAMIHVVVAAFRTWRALDGQPPPRLRPWLLAAALVAAVGLALVAAWLSGGL